MRHDRETTFPIGAADLLAASQARADPGQHRRSPRFWRMCVRKRSAAGSGRKRSTGRSPGCGRTRRCSNSTVTRLRRRRAGSGTARPGIGRARRRGPAGDAGQRQRPGGDRPPLRRRPGGHRRDLGAGDQLRQLHRRVLGGRGARHAGRRRAARRLLPQGVDQRLAHPGRWRHRPPAHGRQLCRRHGPAAVHAQLLSRICGEL